jgi:hypothetical protein
MTVKRVPLQSVVVMRDGQSFCPPIGVVFEFTSDEVKQIERMRPEAISAQATVDAEKAEAPPSKAKGKKGDNDKPEGDL